MNEILPLTKESILKAVEIIDQNPYLRKGRESIEYDFVLDGKRYPPILILSEANKFLGGQELLLSDFGNSTKKAFKFFDDLNYKIEKKYPAITKEAVIEIIDLCEKMAIGRENGSISQNTYTEKFRPFLDSFEDKFSYSPNLYLQNQLQNFYTSYLKNVSAKLDFKSFGFWGRSIYNYVWSCIYYDFDVEAIPASYSPQLYILVNRYGIKFGFCYGQYINDTDAKVSDVIKDKEKFALLKKAMQDDRTLGFFNKVKSEVTARPEKLFGEKEKIRVANDENIISNWSSNSLLVKEFTKENIPENINEFIEQTLSNLKDFFLSLLPISTETSKKNIPQLKVEFSVNKVKNDFIEHGLYLHESIVTRFTSSLIAKPFVILTGLSGSGKSKLAQAFALWICESEEQYCFLPVGADWTNREPLLGFPNALKEENYIKPDNGVLDLVIQSSIDENKPYFLILDEMNLSHVERYFADFLSAMESNEKISLHFGNNQWNDVPSEIKLPKNLFIIGTVNIDETTYMFSPKVLDRANVIEFKVTVEEMNSYLNNKRKFDIAGLRSLGSDMGSSFVSLARNPNIEIIDDEISKVLLAFFKELKKTGSEFGYRSVSEIFRFAAVVNLLESNWTKAEIIDSAIMQKLLPKVHGSRRKLEPILKTLIILCLQENQQLENYIPPKNEMDFTDKTKIKYPISLEKILRMYDNLISNGFTSYAEA